MTRAYVLVTVMPRYSRSMMASYYGHRPPNVSKSEFRFIVVLRWVSPCGLPMLDGNTGAATPVAFAP